MKRVKSVFIFPSTISLVRVVGTRCDRQVKITVALCGTVAIILWKPSSLGCWSCVRLDGACPDITNQMPGLACSWFLGQFVEISLFACPKLEAREHRGGAWSQPFQHLLLLFLLNRFSLTALFDTFFHFLRDIFIQVERMPGRWYFEGHLLFFFFSQNIVTFQSLLKTSLWACVLQTGTVRWAEKRAVWGVAPTMPRAAQAAHLSTTAPAMWWYSNKCTETYA